MAHGAENFLLTTCGARVIGILDPVRLHMTRARSRQLSEGGTETAALFEASEASPVGLNQPGGGSLECSGKPFLAVGDHQLGGPCLPDIGIRVGVQKVGDEALQSRRRVWKRAERSGDALQEVVDIGLLVRSQGDRAERSKGLD
jgi:hypothetical protein